MKKKKSLIVFLIVLSSVMFGFSSKKIRKVEKNQSKVVNNLDEFNDIRLWLEMCQGDGWIKFKLPKNDTIQDYNTYYGNLILFNLEENYVDKKIIGYIDNIVAEKNFMLWKDEDVFEGIEKCYYYDDLCRRIIPQYYNKNIEKYVSQLIKKSYNKTGFFISEEFKERIKKMGEDESKTLKLAQTMEMLYLCERYNFIERIDKEKVSNWLIQSIQLSNNYIIDNYYVIKSLKYMKCYDILEKIKIKNLEYNEVDFFEIFCYLNICKEYNIAISQDEKMKLQNLVIQAFSKLSVCELKEIYYATEIIKMIDGSINFDLKKEIYEKINIFKYKSGLFPVISEYIVDNKQVLMYYEMTTELGIINEVKQISSLLMHDFAKMDSFDIYAYAVLCKNMNQDVGEIRREVIKQLEISTLDEKNKIMYLLRTLNYIGSIDECDCMNEEIEEYVNIIANHNEKEGYNALDLILLYGYIDLGRLQTGSTLIKNINNIKIKENDELATTLLYYKYKILLKLDYDFDKNEVYKQLNRYRCIGGYKKRKSDSFMDLQITYLFLDLKSSLDNNKT